MALVVSVWYWLLTTLHAICWSFGIVHGYLKGGMIPLYPTIPVTYASLFMHSLGAFAITFLLAFTVCSVLAPRLHIGALMVVCLVGAIWGATDISFVYQIDFGTTWRPHESFFALFSHPVVTPFWVALSLAGPFSLTRPLRQTGVIDQPI